MEMRITGQWKEEESGEKEDERYLGEEEEKDEEDPRAEMRDVLEEVMMAKDPSEMSLWELEEEEKQKVIGPETVRHPAPQHPEVELKEDMDEELFRPLTHRWPQEDNIQQDTGNPGRGPNGAHNDGPHREAVTTADPPLSVQVNEDDLPFLVDTGATCSTLNTRQVVHLLSHKTTSVMGFSLCTKVGKQTVMHPFVYSPTVLVNLMGSDLLIRLGATILCGPEGLMVTLPGGTKLPCSSGLRTSSQYLIQPVQEQWADIYWCLLEQESTCHTGALSAYFSWKPWISLLEPYTLPPDPPHVTLYYSLGMTPTRRSSVRTLKENIDSLTDVGLMDCIPIDFQVQQGNLIWIHQYPHKQVAELGIRDTIEGLLQAGVLEPSYSAWNTPILLVEKKGTGKYRMVHDLWAINDILLTPTVPVPNPYAALANLGPQQKWFTCIDLANAFFCLPLAEQCRDIFSFTFQGRQLRYTHLPQGFALSPGLFNQVLKEALGECSLPPDTILIQYVDDLMIAAPTAQTCLIGTQTVLQNLADRVFKVSKDKLQVARSQVSFLGRLISQRGAGMSPAHRSTILHHLKPEKVKDMLSFLGLTGYSRNYAPNYVGLTQPIRRLVTEQGMRNLTNPLNWTADVEKAVGSGYGPQHSRLLFTFSSGCFRNRRAGTRGGETSLTPARSGVGVAESHQVKVARAPVDWSFPGGGTSWEG
ncbi:hypothetical protein P4O66_004093 [Electrophorus voltai]|uniref:ribonuclease H n=1 Tax=Electrophorus voltai TaxID=2609070 RepID=A0AAD9E319_9TELE|nr:hypothetical protein P4O66_004093 [Electrophorus voltai]